MAVDQSGVRWPDVPIVGAVGAEQKDWLVPDGGFDFSPPDFGLTPSGQAEQDAAQPAEITGEVPGAGPE